MIPAHAPIALFVYNRPEHARRTLERLKQCEGFDQSPLVIFCDGPKTSRDVEPVRRVRRTVRAIFGEKADIIEADSNQGLADSIIKGVTALCAEYGRVIVVEDDLVVGRSFLTYLNAALEKYAVKERVMQVSAHMFPIPEFSMKREAFFLPFTTSWGWATWQRAWSHFDTDATGWKILKSDLQIRKRFNLDGAYDYFSMLKKQMAGQVDSWAIRWYWSVFKVDGLVLFPPQTLVENIGFDGSGTHGWRGSRRNFQVDQMMTYACIFPKEVKVVEKYLDELKAVLKPLGKGSFASRMHTFIKKLSREGK